MTRDDHGRGVLAAWGAYGIWGLFPLYFHALKPAGAWEILSHRIVWTLVFCALILAVRRDLAWLPQMVRRPRLAAGVSVAAILIAINWVVYVYAVITGRTNEAALGYFLNPLVTVALGVVVLRERLRPLQWIAVAIGAVAGIYLAIAAGTLPWIATTLAFSFALYGLTKKRLGASLPALRSLTAETIVLAPIAVGILIWLSATGASTFTVDAPLHPALLVAAGAVTAAPLLLFAAATRRIPLVTIGLIQFITPVIQLLMAVTFLGERLPTERWIGFGIVWLALIVLSADSVQAGRRRRVPAAEPI
ncbi:EamA family transporter RarD [Janibacter sp. GXQ6167]|uniref:EamA family transporter RarD n=1 Tax=Janibacter sp. GXQ6167 TaxID=3240791 RepID=UPI00352325AD